MIHVISKATFGSYNVRDIQCNANWCGCPYSDYALIPDNLVEGVLATQGYCDITLNDAGTEVTGFTARAIPDVPEECHGTNTVLSVDGVRANSAGEVTLHVCKTAILAAASWTDQTQTVDVTGVTTDNTVVVSPHPASHTAYGEAGVYCFEQTNGKLTFKCEDVPSSDLTVNVMYFATSGGNFEALPSAEGGSF
jgi:hypothetical protein